MIQIRYRWHVDPSNSEAFDEAWGRATHVIRRTRSGCYGSMLLRATDDPEGMVATAFWESEEAWRASKALGPADPRASAEMATIAEVISVEVLEVVHDFYRPAGA